MDFFDVVARPSRRDRFEIFPDFKICKFKDLMIRGGKFYAIWDENKQLWSTDEFDVSSLVDKELDKYVKENMVINGSYDIRYMSTNSSRSWKDFKQWIMTLPDTYKQLDVNVTFQNTPIDKKSYVSRRLPYSLEDGDISAYEELVGTLYEPEELQKIEWAIGAVISGDSKSIQKFLVFYGDPGTGKSTILNIIQMLFEGYYAMIDAKALTNSSNQFATELFKSNPLVAIQHDGDLSRIEDNSKLNSIVSHEEIVINEKRKTQYTMKMNSFLFMATNKPVKITDAKAGLIRRLIDVRPSGNKVEFERYNELWEQIPFELGAIAQHCLDVYRSMGKSYYNSYRPTDMMYKTDPFFNFVEYNIDTFLQLDKEQGGIALRTAYNMYKEYCDEADADYKLQMYRFREEFKNYYREYYDQYKAGTFYARSFYSGFLVDKFRQSVEDIKKNSKEKVKKSKCWLDMEQQPSKLDILLANCKAQYAKGDVPGKKWGQVTTTLKDLSTDLCHYVQPPTTMIVIDFDIKDENGNKSFELNYEAAKKWPKTYAETSKSGAGIHLHYIYNGNVDELANLYDKDIEIKVFQGNSALRRMLTICNACEVAVISSGLPLREIKGDKMVNFETLKSEKSLRRLVIRNLQKEIHPSTKSSIDFIYKILDDAYNSGLHYDLTDLYPDVMAFACSSTHQSQYCCELVMQMKFKSEDPSEPVEFEKEEIVFYDVEVFPNLFLINWKYKGNPKVARMINPTPSEVEELCKHKLVGFNCRRYDNHMLWARMSGYDNARIYELSQRIVNGSSNAFFGEAYNLSYTDVYDYCSKKQSLKKWEIELGIHHHELGLPWDQPVPEDKWQMVAEYCDDDVIATEAVWDATQADFIARQILADVAGLTVNDTTNSLTTRIIFGKERHPQSEFVYTDLSEMFPGYKFDNGKSYYRGEITGEGGYVYAEPGMYQHVVTFDVASMHPSSVIALNLFGDTYTARFKEILDARVAIKHKDFEKAKTMLGGVLSKYLTDPDMAKALAQALKIAINSVYGLTSASFDNPCRDPRNKDNIVAKRGALFMINLKHEVQERGFTVAHIKTDSIKVVDPTPEIAEFIVDYGKQYGYNFEIEHKFEKICLVNDAVYVAKCEADDPEEPGQWTATGAQFAVPYIFKKLFSKDEINFDDLCETKTVSSGLMYLDMNEALPDVSMYEKELADRGSRTLKLKASEFGYHYRNPQMENMPDEELVRIIETGHSYQFVGKAGLFTPIKPGRGGGVLYREKDDKYYSVTGTKGYRWLESEIVESLGKEGDVDMSYYEALAADAIDTINQFGSFEDFVSDDFAAPFSRSNTIK